MTDRNRPDDLAELIAVTQTIADQQAGEPAPQITRIRLRPEIIDEAGWHEIRNTVALWVAAGDAILEDSSSSPVPPDQISAIDDVKDLYGLRLVLLEPYLARMASAELNVRLKRPDLDHTLNPDLRQI